MLYAVVIKGVYPVQCVTVYDNKDNAIQLAKYLSNHVTEYDGLVGITEVDSFYPVGMTEPDTAWLVAYDDYNTAKG